MRHKLRRLAGGVFADTLLGFEDRSLEEAFQVELMAASRRTDVVADVLWIAMMLYVGWKFQQRGAGGSTLYMLAVSCPTFAVRLASLRWPDTPGRARLRTCTLLVLRVHASVCTYLTGPPLEIPNLSLPDPGPQTTLRNVITTTRVPASLMWSLGQRLPFRLHLPLQLASVALFGHMNWRMCSHCSPAMQDTFMRLAGGLTRAVSAGLLLPPPQQAPLPKDRACFTVTVLAFLVLGVLLPTAFLLYTETKCRMEFLSHQQQRPRHQPPQQQQQQQQPCSDREAARARLSKEASLAAFPLLVGALALPLTGLLWNLLLHAHRLL